MRMYFTVSELAKAQGISRQTLIYYDRIGLFHPSFTDPSNGYRYYSSDQLDELDTISMLKAAGLSLDEIRKELAAYTTSSALKMLNERISDIDRKIAGLRDIRTRLVHRLDSVAQALNGRIGQVTLAHSGDIYIFKQQVKPPYSYDDVSLATKLCLTRARKEKVSVHFQSGAILSQEKLLQHRFLETDHVFFPCDRAAGRNCEKIPGGLTVSILHKGEYSRTGESYAPSPFGTLILLKASRSRPKSATRQALIRPECITTVALCSPSASHSATVSRTALLPRSITSDKVSSSR